ncbi:MAG TPA: GTP-binding protein [Patescibacteria group bacterium]|nr:GTP-binding protein [Patescibacteria group bacterium]
MKIMLFGGFLGSGKTTTLLQVARYAVEQKKWKVAVIENEIGEVGLDDKLLTAGGLQVRPLFGGCVCCQITSDLVTAIHDIHQEVQPDLLMIEVTGLAIPGNIVKTIEQYCRFHQGIKTVILVDGSRWRELIEILEPLITSQVSGSQLILLNKADLAGAAVDRIRGELANIAGEAPIITIQATACFSPAEMEAVFDGS